MGNACCSGDETGTIVEPIDEQLLPLPVISYDAAVQNVSYTSDVTGQWDSFCNFVGFSSGLSFELEMDPQDRRRKPEDFQLVLGDGWHFVYGGDVTDRGPGALRFLQAMVQLKKACPDRVHLLLGNGDVYKLGWAGALSEEKSLHPPVELQIKLWEEPEAKEEIDDEAEFENRREELALLAGTPADEVQDETVRDDFAQSLKPGGALFEYLQQSKLGVQLGKTLFIDGQVIAQAENDEQVELSEDEVQKQKLLSEETQAWLVRMNQWAAASLARLEGHPEWFPQPRSGKSVD